MLTILDGGMGVELIRREAISTALAALAPLTELPFGAYPNRLHIPSGWTLDNDVPTGVRDDLDIASYCSYTDRWRALGASIIGGCCGIGLEYIDALKRRAGEEA